jgi:hypothetical protein
MLRVWIIRPCQLGRSEAHRLFLIAINDPYLPIVGQTKACRPCWFHTRRLSMIYKSGLIGIAAIVAVGFASPAFAQQHAFAVYDSGVNAFAMVPAHGSGGFFVPAANGGGSFGYNENLRRDQW